MTERGERNARALGERLRGWTFAKVRHQSLAARGADLRTGRLSRLGGDDPDLVNRTMANMKAAASRLKSMQSAPGLASHLLFADIAPRNEAGLR